MRIQKIGKKAMVLLLAAACICQTGCGATTASNRNVTTGKNLYSSSTETGTEKELDQKKTNTTGLYMITQIDTQAEMMTFMKLENGKLVEHGYTGGTHFYNKYGDLMSNSKLEMGQVVTFETSEDTGALTVMQVSDKVWQKDDVSNYSIDMDKNILAIGESNYSCDKNTKFFSGNGEIMAGSLDEQDELRIVGIDKKVLSVTVTTGQGEIVLKNTDLFNGGFIKLSGTKKYYYEIADAMSIEIPEGSYEVTVANNGYGDTTEVMVERNQRLEIDLNTLKGEGPKSCMMSFLVTVPDTTILLDGAQVDSTQPVPVTYGNHTIQAAAVGYPSWTRRLMVNSDSANIIVDLMQSEEDTEDTEISTEQSTTSNSTTGNTSTGTTSTGTSSNGDSSTGTTSTANSSSSTSTQEYLNTLSGIIDTLTDSSYANEEGSD